MKLLKYFKHLFTHEWIEVSHEGPFTQYKCNKCNKNKINGLITGTTTW